MVYIFFYFSLISFVFNNITAGNPHKQNSRFCKEIREDNFLVEQLEITKKLLFVLYLFSIFCACLKKGSWFWSVARHMNDGLFLINGIVNCHCSFRVYSFIYTRNTRIETYYVLVRSILTNSRNIENWWIPYTHGKAVYISWLNRVRWNIKKNRLLWTDICNVEPPVINNPVFGTLAVRLH